MNHEQQQHRLDAQRAEVEQVIAALRDSIASRDETIRSLEKIVSEHEALMARTIAALRENNRETFHFPGVPYVEALLDAPRLDPMADTLDKCAQFPERIETGPLTFRRTSGIRQWVAEVPGYVRYVLDYVPAAHGLKDWVEVLWANLDSDDQQYRTLQRTGGGTRKFAGVHEAARSAADHWLYGEHAREIEVSK